MENLSGFPYLEIEFTKEGEIYQLEAVNALLSLMQEGPITDLLVMAHGWNNDMAEARELYRKLVALLANELSGRMELSDRRFAVLGVLWPSKRFAKDELIAGGGAASLTPVSDKEELLNQLQELRQFFDGADSELLIEQAIQQAAGLDADPNAPITYVSIMQTLLSQMATPGAEEPEDYAANYVNPEEADPILTRMSEVELVVPVATWEGATNGSSSVELAISGEGGGASIGSVWNGLVTGARNLLNFVTYYQMKARAGKVGVRGLHPVLLRIKEAFPSSKIHLIGHSFGARVATAATAGPTPESSLPVQTLTLLQAAFSHYGFAQNYAPGRDGLFRSVLTQKKVKGPILISCTHNDKAVGIAYALASRVAGQIGAFMGDKDDYFGGMGANGAQKSEADEHFSLNASSSYEFQAGRLYNLNADHCIRDHSDICQPEVAKAITASIAIQ